MAKSSSKLSGGGGSPKQAEPKTVEGDNITLRVKLSDSDEPELVNVSIQDMSEYDNLVSRGIDRVSEQGKIGGSFATAPVARALASQAFNNARSNSTPNFIDIPEGAEGVFKKTDKVPVQRNAGDSVFLEATSGYVTKINGQTVFLQKVSGGYQWNLNGMLMGGKKMKSVKAAKEDTWASNMLERNGNSDMVRSSRGRMIFLNKNRGKVSNKVMKELQMGDFTRIG